MLRGHGRHIRPIGCYSPRDLVLYIVSHALRDTHRTGCHRLKNKPYASRPMAALDQLPNDVIDLIAQSCPCSCGTLSRTWYGCAQSHHTRDRRLRLSAVRAHASYVLGTGSFSAAYDAWFHAATSRTVYDPYKYKRRLLRVSRRVTEWAIRTHHVDRIQAERADLRATMYCWRVVDRHPSMRMLT